MMSNGPCSCLRLFHSGWRSIVGRLDLLRRVEHEDVAEALALQAAQRPAQLLRSAGG